MLPEEIKVGGYYSTEMGGTRRVTRIERYPAGSVYRISYMCSDSVAGSIEANFAPMNVYVNDWYPATAEEIEAHKAMRLRIPEPQNWF